MAALLLNRRDTAAGQASKVYVVVEKHNPDAEQGPPELIASIHNDADQPVFDLSISLWRWGKRQPLWRLAGSTNGWMTDGPITGRIYPTITSATVITDDSLPPVEWPVAPATSNSFNPPVMLRFRDANGRRWVRWPDGKLTRRRPSRA